LALERAFLLTPLPTDEIAFKRRLEEGRGRLTLIANEIARLAAQILQECATAARKIKDTKTAPEACADAAQQLQRLMPKRFLMAAPWERLHHLTRYLKAITRPRCCATYRVTAPRAALLALGCRAQRR
jgi:ATP-dependent helicase HrpA